MMHDIRIRMMHDLMLKKHSNFIIILKIDQEILRILENH